MPPSTITGLSIVLVFVLPGSLYTWAFERQNSAFGVTLADRILRFLAVSVFFHLALGWPEYALYRMLVDGRGHVLTGKLALLWVGLLMLIGLSAGLGTVLGGLYATRTDRTGWTWIRRRLNPAAEQRLLSPRARANSRTTSVGSVDRCTRPRRASR